MNPSNTSRHIYLTGLTGSGKTTIAPLLADLLGWAWLDLDPIIEARTGQTIPALFAQDEGAFRAAETAALREVAERADPTVIATGGGVVLAEANRVLMAATGVVVALDVAPAVAAARVMAQSIDRPLVRGDALARIRDLHVARGPLYAQAPVRVATDDAPPDAVARRVLAAIVARGRLPRIDAPSQTIAVATPSQAYAITIAWGALGKLADELEDARLPRQLTLVTDTTIAPLYLDGVRTGLEAAGYAVGVSVIPAGETQKTLATVEAVYDELITRRAERGAAIIALGGGVVGDLAGFTAATYLRGVPLIQVPTTLLAQVDAAIGGKTGVNHPRAKNMIGAFYQPLRVVIDPAVLLTLSDRLFREGLGEVAKYGAILDADLFALLEDRAADLLRRDPALLCEVIGRCAQIKARIVSEDEREGGERILLNYGHTIGHALEALTGYSALLHGEAVWLGMAVEAQVARAMGVVDDAFLRRQNALACALGAPASLPAGLTPAAILAATRLDKKSQGGQVRWVLPTALGHATTRIVPDDVALAAIADFGTMRA